MLKDWNMMRLVLEVSRAGSLSGAAARLGVNHATVSRQLSRAEEDLGRRLFDRLPTGMVPTAAGDAIAVHGARMEAETLTLDFELGAREDAMAGPLAVTIPPLLADDGFAADLVEYRDLYPGVDLQVLGDNRVFDLNRREADVALRVTRRPTDTLWGRKIMDQRAGFFAAPGFTERHAAGLVGDAEVPIISFTAWSEAVPEGIRQAYPTAAVAVTCDDMGTALTLAKQGIGMVRAPFFVGNGATGLDPILNGPVIDYAPIWMLTHPDLRTRTRITHFMGYMAERFRARRAWFQKPA